MKLIKTTIFSGIITLVRTAAGFISTKFVAIFVGPSGVALVGQFINFITIIYTFGNGAINTGVVKYTAELQDDEEKLKSLFSSSMKITITCSVFIGALCVLFSKYISSWLFDSALYSYPVVALGLGLIFYSVNALLISILNGKGQIKDYSIVNITGSLASLTFTVILVYYLKLSGALFALAISQSVVLLITVFLILKSSWFKWSYFNGRFDREMGRKLASFGLMALVSVLTVPLSQMILRTLVINRLGIGDAGLWQGMMRISDAYLMVITTALSTYFLPKLSTLKEDHLIRKEIFTGYKIILPFLIGSCILIFFLREFIVHLLYTPEFMNMKDLFFFQLLGDVFKISAWILAFLMQAKAMTRMYIATEIIFSATYLLFAHFLVNLYGVKGTVIAFSLNYLLYLITMVVLFRKLLINKNR